MSVSHSSCKGMQSFVLNWTSKLRLDIKDLGVEMSRAMRFQVAMSQFAGRE